MSNEKEISLEELEDLLDQDDHSGSGSSLKFQTIYTTLVLNWQWFALSLFICLCGAMIYLRYATPVYRVTAKMLIKEDDNRRQTPTNQMLANMQDFGFLSNSEGILNEVEILQSHILAQDAIKDLKIYVDYYTPGRIRDELVYKTQPVCVDLDMATLERWDQILLDYDSLKCIKLSITKHEKHYEVKGETLLGGKPTGTFTKNCPRLPARVKTGDGVLTLTKNEGREMKVGDKSLVMIVPPMARAAGYVNSIKIEPISKQTSIAELTFNDFNMLRGKDYLRQLAVCYNRQANIDKNEIAMKTEEFINSRLTKIDAELGSTEGMLENYKKRNAVVNLTMDATQTLAQSAQYETKLTEITSQIQVLDYLREYVDNPSNQYKIIPSNVGMNDQSSATLIDSYNQSVQERNRYLKTSSEQAPHVILLTSTLDELLSSIRTALTQARHSAVTQRQGIQRQLNKYTGRIGNTPEQERVLTQIGRQQVFVDIDPSTGNIDPAKIEAAITPHTTAIMPVHVYGTPCKTKKIQNIADRHGLKVIYDAAHAFGVEKEGESILKAGNISTLSFHATKVFTTIEGGAMIVHSAEMKQRIDYLKNFGFEDDVTVVGPGINSKMDEVRSAFGLLNLQQVDAAIEARHRVATAYREALCHVEGITFWDDQPGVRHNYGYFPIFVDARTYGLTRDALYFKLQEQGIFGRRYFYPLISTFTPYRSLPSAAPQNLPVATKLADEVICLPMHHALSDGDVQKVIEIIIEQTI